MDHVLISRTFHVQFTVGDDGGVFGKSIFRRL